MTQSENPNKDLGANAALFSTSSPSLEQYYCERLENVRQKLPEAARLLKDAGVVRVEIFYDGCGDSGQIERISYFNTNCKMMDLPGKVTITEEALLDLFYDLLEVRHAGWENNDGAFGEFEWDLVSDTLAQSHSERYVECDTTEHEGI